MSDWIHWIGKSYYTMNSFAKEAEEYGISRRISLRDAKNMTWGDTIYTAMLDGKTGVIFGYFKVHRITGLSPETTAKVVLKTECKQVNGERYAVNRGCGEYQAGPTWSTTADIEEIIEIAEETQDKLNQDNKIMVGGPFTETARTRLLDIPFRQGFRKFDTEAFYQSTTPYTGRVHGQFYVRDDDEDNENIRPNGLIGEIQQVTNYKKNTSTRKKGQRKARMRR